MKHFSTLATLLAAVLHVPTPGQLPVARADATALLPAALAQDWSSVRAQCAEDAPDASIPRAALLAQACLWQNRAGEATRILLRLMEPEAAAAWLTFAAQLAREQPELAVARYLHGDALARTGDFAGALAAFDAALDLDVGLVPALIARGVVRTRKSLRDDGARRDFEAACRRAPELAEAHASLGTLQVLRQAAEGAERSLQRALSLAPDHVLARNGLGCARYGLGHAAWPQAMADFAAAAERLPLPLFEANLLALAVAAEKTLYPGQDEDPAFRFSDFLDWAALVTASAQDDTPIRLLHGAVLPVSLDAPLLARLNVALADPRYPARVARHLEGKDLPARLREVMADDLTPGPGRVLVRNRRLLEYFYPGLILPHDGRNPGTTLDLNVSAVRAGRIAVPRLELNFNRTSTSAGRQAGGVSTDQSAGFVDRGPWPVATWFGLLHSMPEDFAALQQGGGR